ncbi:MAG: hypothetical protein D6768_17460 [Chloroflexi bacterium]|nr:MAG: hypothetical protein D6768_17460 [Chloroflexota bacterium]
MDQTRLVSQLNRIQKISLVVGIVALVVGAGGLLTNRAQFFQSYLLGYIFVLSIPLGHLGILMIHHLVGGKWGFSIRRILESGAMTLPVMALLYIPIIVGYGYLYPWTDPATVAESHLLQYKEPWLNVPFFIVRTVIYFIIWSGLAFLLNKWSLQQDKSDDPTAITTRLKNLSAPGMILFILTTTFAAYDWGMSLDPLWFSSMYGVIFFAGHAVAAVATAILVANFIAKRNQKFADRVDIYVFNDLSNFLLAFVSFWAYVSFSQYLIIWASNLPETITWYVVRTQNGWQVPATMLIFLGFAVPFALLLSRKNKRNIKLLIGLSVWVLVMRYVDFFWILMPTFSPYGFYFHWLNLVIPVGLAGIWLFLFIRQLKGKPLLAQNDPRFHEAAVHELKEVAAHE